jgi:hypothetical protein
MECVKAEPTLALSPHRHSLTGFYRLDRNEAPGARGIGGLLPLFELFLRAFFALFSTGEYAYGLD